MSKMERIIESKRREIGSARGKKKEVYRYWKDKQTERERERERESK